MHGEALLPGEDRLLEEEVRERGENDGDGKGDQEANELILRTDGCVREMLAENVDDGLDEDVQNVEAVADAPEEA